VLAHLQALTWRFRADGRPVWAIAPYAEPVVGTGGAISYRPRRAAESGDEGWACVDDAARATLLALGIASVRARDLGAPPRASPARLLVSTAREPLLWARRWLSFVRYMQLPNGRFANFVLDAMGTRNLAGPTSVPGGVWWTGRALWALARFHRLTGSRWALDAWLRCPLPDLGDAGKTLGLFTLAACELLQAHPTILPSATAKRLAHEQQRLRPLVLQWCEAIVASGPDYFRDFPVEDALPLWGYHQLHAVATAARLLDRADWVEPCAATVRNLVAPVIAARGLYRWDPMNGSTKAGLCVYCLSPLVQGLAEAFRLTGDTSYRRLAREAIAWVYGRNDARSQLYDPTTGRCSDGLDGPDATIPSHNYGAESSVEAGFMELERRALRAPHHLNKR
jgi:hypothetical protein